MIRYSKFLRIEWLLFLGAAWLSFDSFLLGKYSYLATAFEGELFVPGLLANKVAGFGSPYWHVFAGGGNDRLALGFFGWFRDATYAVLPGWAAQQFLGILQLASAVIGVYALCRRTLGQSRSASALSALLYGYSFSSGSNFYTAQAYLPTVVLGLSLVFEDRRDWKRWLLLLVSGFLLSTTAPLQVIMPFSFFLLFIWFTVVEPRRAATEWAIIVGFSLFLAVLRAQDYVAVGVYGLLSGRHAMASWADASFRVDLLAETFASVFLGRPPLAFASAMLVLTLALYRWRRSGLVRLVTAILVGLGMIVAVAAVKSLAVDAFPVLRTFNVLRFSRTMEMFLVMTAGFGVMALGDWADGDNSRPQLARRVCRAAPLLAFALLFLVSFEQKVRHVKHWVTDGGYAHNFESPVLRDLAGEIRRSGQPARVASFQMQPSYPNGYGIETVGSRQSLIIKRYQDFWNRILEPSRETFPSAAKDEPLQLWLNPEERRAEWNLAELYDLDLLSLANVKYVVSRDRLITPSLTLLRGPEVPWSALTDRQKIETNIRGNFTGRTHLYVYENQDVLPRFFVVDALRVLPTAGDVLDAVARADIEALRRTVFAERAQLPPGVSEATPLSGGTVRLQSYGPDEIRLSLELEGAAVLVAANTYSPYWRSRVDGVETPLFPADHAFWGVYLPKSAKSVFFYYDPPYRVF